MEIEKSKGLIQFLLIFRQFRDVLFFLYARRLRGYTATSGHLKYKGEQGPSSDSCGAPLVTICLNIGNC